MHGRDRGFKSHPPRKYKNTPAGCFCIYLTFCSNRKILMEEVPNEALFKLKKLFYYPNFWFAIAALLSIFVIFSFFAERTFWQGIQRQKVESSKQVAKGLAEVRAKIETARKSAEKSQKTETELSKEMLDATADFETRMGVAGAWAKKHVSNSEYCWKVDVSPVPKVVKPKQKEIPPHTDTIKCCDPLRP